MKVSVVYVAYRTPADLLLKSIESTIVAGAAANVELEILIADNGGLPDRIRDLPNVRFTGSGKNIGFGAAVNEAVRAATGDHVLLMNPDSTLASGALTHLVRASTAATAPTIFGALLVKEGSPQVLAYNLWWGTSHLRLKVNGWRRHLDSLVARGTPAEVTRLCGAGLFASRSALLSLGPFDDDFFLYGEDVDLSLRAKDAGFRLVLVPQAVVDHEAGTSSDAPSGLVVRAQTDAHLRVLARRRGPFRSLIGRAEVAAIALISGIARGNRVARHAQLQEVRRWGLEREAPPFDPHR